MTSVFVGGLPIDDAASKTGDTYTGTMSISGKFEYARGASEAVTANKTLDEGDIGVVQKVSASCTVTLPATVVGYVYKIMNNYSGDKIKITISPNASDKIMGNGFTAADDTGIINTKTTSYNGDFVTLIGDGADGWMISEIQGTWAQAVSSASVSESASISPSVSSSSSLSPSTSASASASKSASASLSPSISQSKSTSPSVSLSPSKSASASISPSSSLSPSSSISHSASVSPSSSLSPSSSSSPG